MNLSYITLCWVKLWSWHHQNTLFLVTSAFQHAVIYHWTIWLAPGQLPSSLRIMTFWSVGRKKGSSELLVKYIHVVDGARSLLCYSHISLCNPTFDVFVPVSFVREKAPEVGDARHRDGQKLLYNNWGLLLWQNLVGQQLSILHEWITSCLTMNRFWF